MRSAATPRFFELKLFCYALLHTFTSSTNLVRGTKLIDPTQVDSTELTVKWLIVDMSIIRYQLKFSQIMCQHVIGFLILSQFKPITRFITLELTKTCNVYCF